MFDKDNFKTIMKLHLDRYKILKESKRFEEAMEELEKVVTLFSEGIMTIFGKSKIKYIKPKSTNLIEGVRNITLEDVIDPKNIITIDKEGFLRKKIGDA